MRTAKKLRVRGQGDSIRTVLSHVPVLNADETIREKMKIGRLARERCAALQTAVQIREPAHETSRPKSKVGNRHPDVIDAGLLQHRKQQAENNIVWIVIGERLLQYLGEKGESRGPRVIYRLGQRRVQDVKRVETYQLLAGLLGIVGTNMGHGLKGAAKTAPRPGRRLGYTLDLPVVAGKQRNDLVGFMNGPGSQDDSFHLVNNHGRPA